MIHRRIFVLFLTVLLTIPMFAASAQTPEASTYVDPRDLPGIQSAGWRDYAPPGTMMGDGRVLPGDATPITDEELAQP